MHFHIEQISEDGLSSQTWRFCVILSPSTVDVVLDAYTVSSRATKRHRFRTDGQKSYNRLQRSYDFCLPESEVPWSEDLVSQVQQKMMSFVRIGRWQKDFGR